MHTHIANEQDYDAAIERLIVLMQLDPLPDTPDGRELMQIASAVEQYEQANGFVFVAPEAS